MKAFDTPLFQDLNVQGGKGHVGVMGPNGSGKSTLLKTLIGREKADGGMVRLGHKVQIGYHDQGLESLAPATTVIRAVWPEDDPDWVQEDVRDLLARFGLSGEIVFQTVGQLSGGEKAKAALARLSATGANLLVMDEPTNHLDIWSSEALERSILDFEGTVLVVSHDRYFLNQVADRLIVLGGGRAKSKEITRRTSVSPSKKPRSKRLWLPPSPPPHESKAKDMGKSEKRKRKFPYRKAPDLEREIGEIESNVAELEDLLGQPALWRDPIKARA